MLDDFKQMIAQYQPKPIGEKKRYAVLLPLIWENNEWQVLYQVRSHEISQPGDVAFPGGRLEEGETYQEAAIRETMEELALPKEAITIWGEIDYFVFQDRSIHCFVGQLDVPSWKAIKPNEEVDHLFTVPLQTLLATEPTYYTLEAKIITDNHFPFDRLQQGENYQFSHQNRSVPFYEHLAENLWGMTAQFTHRFTQLIRGNH